MKRVFCDFFKSRVRSSFKWLIFLFQTVSGKDGRENVSVELPFDQKVNFKFLSYRHSYGDDGSKSEGQIPSLHFYVQWPDKNTQQPTPAQINSPTDV